MKVQWQDSYSVGIAEFDRHHQKLFGLLNDLVDAGCAPGGDVDKIPILLKELKDYTNYHFREEEKMLERFAYPHLEKQMVEHKEFEDQLEEFADTYLVGREPLKQDILAFLINWVLNHVTQEDKRYCAYLGRKSVS